MEEDFHQSAKAPKNQLNILMQRSDNPAIMRFTIMYLLFLIISVCVVISWTGPLWQIVLSQLAFGILCCSLFASLHETVHNTAFKSKHLNQIASRLVGIAHLYPSTAFKELHFTHHRYTHIPGKDPEISFANKPLPSTVSNIPSYLVWITGIPMLSFKIFMIIIGTFGMPEFIRKVFFSFIRPEVRKKLVIESAYILLIHGTLIFLALFVNPGFWGLFIGQFIGHCLLAIYLLPEHNGLPHDGNIFNRTRSITNNKLVNLLMWNMTYHAEHHAYPAIPFHALPELRNLIKDEISNKDEGRINFHLKVIKQELQ